jgi:hypothetical protein
MDSKVDLSNFVTIREFLSLSDLSEAELVSLLENGFLSFCAGENNQLLLDVSKINLADLAVQPKTSLDQLSPQKRAEIEEAIGSEVTAALDAIVSEAIELASNWLSSKKNCGS